MSSLAENARTRWSGFVAREGKRTLVVLAILMAVGFGFRLDRVVHPLAEPGDDALVEGLEQIHAGSVVIRRGSDSVLPS